MTTTTRSKTKVLAFRVSTETRYLWKLALARQRETQTAVVGRWLQEYVDGDREVVDEAEASKRTPAQHPLAFTAIWLDPELLEAFNEAIRAKGLVKNQVLSQWAVQYIEDVAAA